MNTQHTVEHAGSGRRPGSGRRALPILILNSAFLIGLSALAQPSNIPARPLTAPATNALAATPAKPAATNAVASDADEKPALLRELAKKEAAKPPPSPAQIANDPTNQSLSAYSAIYQPSIFDPQRQFYRPPAPAGIRQAPPPRIDYLTLSGTMVSDDSGSAFFEGTTPLFNKVAKPGELIGNRRDTNALTVASVGFDEVMLTNNFKAFRLGVGSRLRLQQGGSWSLISRYGAEEVPSSVSTSSDSGPADAAIPSGPMSDVVKRLMEKRAAELK